MMRRAIVIVFLVSLGFGARRTPVVDVLHAGQEPPKVPRIAFFGLSVVGHSADSFTNLYLIMGEDHHSVAAIAEDQIILIDTKSMPGWGAPIMRRLEPITEEQVTTLINTNLHQGGSNSEFPKVVDIIAHENTKMRMASLTGRNAKALPNKTFKDKLSLIIKTTGEDEGANRMDLFYFGPGYTDGDTVVVFPQYNTVLLGELYAGKAVPLIDRANGGSAIRLPDTLDKAFATLKTYTPTFQAVVPVRGEPPLAQSAMFTRWGKLTDLEEYAAFVRALVAACRVSRDAGKTVDEAVTGLSLPERFKGYAMDRLRPFVEAAYDELR